MAINAEKFVVKVALEWPSLREKLLLGHRKGNLICSALCAGDVSVLASGTFLLGFTVPRGAVDADVEDCTATKQRERKLLSEGFGEGLHRALRLEVQIFLRDGLEGRSGASADVEHVDGQRRLVDDLVSERVDISNLVGKPAP